MALDAAFLGLMNQTLQVQPRTGLDVYGQPTHGAQTPVPCRLTFRQRVVAMADGSTEYSRAQAWCPTDTAITSESRVTLPDGTTPRLLQVSKPVDENGNDHHYELFFQ